MGFKIWNGNFIVHKPEMSGALLIIPTEHTPFMTARFKESKTYNRRRDYLSNPIFLCRAMILMERQKLNSTVVWMLNMVSMKPMALDMILIPDFGQSKFDAEIFKPICF